MKNKIQEPKISNNLGIPTNVIDEIFEEEYLENKIIENTTISGIYEVRLSLNSCIFKNVEFESCDFRKIDITDVIFENCNLSNINFDDSGIYRTKFVNCK
ncbi:MAG: pentapeptide repeat-containing protein, partial [Paraclostridium bifermentans]